MPQLTLSIIVKNEEHYLRDCFDSVKDVVDEIILIDTGSSDNTVKIAHEYGAKVLNYEWTNDYSAARNFALTKASGDWVLFLDADERVYHQSLVEIKKIIQSNQKIAYNCFIKSSDKLVGREFMIRAPRLFANNHGIKFSGRVNEHIEPSLAEKEILAVNSKIFIRHIGYEVSEHEASIRAQRNLHIFMDVYESTKTYQLTYNIANYFELMKEPVNAEKYYRITAENIRVEKQYRTLAFSSLALIYHQQRVTHDSEKNIINALKLDERQPFSHYLSSKISLRKGEYLMAEDKCKRAYQLNTDMIYKSFDFAYSVTINQEELIYFGITLALKNRNTPNYQYFQKELFVFYQRVDGENSTRAEVIRKLFNNIQFLPSEIEVLSKLINNSNLGFFVYMFGNNPYKKQIIEILQIILNRFPQSVEVQKLLAKLLDEFGMVDNAVLVMERLCEYDQSDPTIFFYLISYYLKQGAESKIKPIVGMIEKNFSHLPDVMSRVRTLRRKLLTLTTVPL